MKTETRHYRELSNIYQLLVFLLLLFIVFELLREEIETKIVVGLSLIPVFIYILCRCKKVLTLEHKRKFEPQNCKNSLNIKFSVSVLQSELVPVKNMDYSMSGKNITSTPQLQIEAFRGTEMKPYYCELTKMSELEESSKNVMV